MVRSEIAVAEAILASKFDLVSVVCGAFRCYENSLLL